jgi:hypothetical protein
MTFYEAALHVLGREGKPLHVNEIVEMAVRENLLSHIGKSPEEVMQSRLLAMARRRSEKKIMTSAPMTYGLVEWGLPEEPAALVVLEQSRHEEGPPLRPRERHPLPSIEKVKIAGRGERQRGKGRREELEDRRRRKYLPLSEVAIELLSQGEGPIAALELASVARERELVSEDLGAEALLSALREDNRRRSEANRRPVFALSPEGEISLCGASDESDSKVEQVACLPVLEPRTARVERGPGANRLISQAADHRRQIMRLLRRRLSDLDATGVERVASVVLEQYDFRDLRVARKGKDSTLLLAKRRDGLSDLRFAILVFRNGADIGRSEITEFRRDAVRLGAQMGMLLCPSDVSREVKQDAQSPGMLPLVLWCAEAFAEKCLLKNIGSSCTMVEVWDLDEDFFRSFREKGKDKDEERTRRSRRGKGSIEKAANSLSPAHSPISSPISSPTSSLVTTPTGRDSLSSPSVPLVGNSDTQTNSPASISPEQIELSRLSACTEEELTAKANDAAEIRKEEEKIRAEAHERIEAAELSSSARRSTIQ